MKTLILLLMFITPLFAQEQKTHEVQSNVQELSDFHDVIYSIWHTGWDQKDIPLLQSLAPEVEKGFEKIKNAELPGILRDKKAKWDEGLARFAECVEKYKDASVKRDSVSLLNAAEQLHSQFEKMVRIIRPVLKEVDSFHQKLYVLYHYYLPEYNYDKIKTSSDTLSTRMVNLVKSELPARLNSKAEDFNKAKSELNDAVKSLNETVAKGNDKEAIKSAINNLHTKYQELEKVFD